MMDYDFSAVTRQRQIDPSQRILLIHKDYF